MPDSSLSKRLANDARNFHDCYYFKLVEVNFSKYECDEAYFCVT